MATSLSSKLAIKDVDVANKRVLIRVDFNVPIKDGKIKDTNRIDEALPTIQYALSKNAKAVILMSHLGRPDGTPNKKYSLAPLLPYLNEKLQTKVIFVKDCVGDEAEKVCANPQPKSIILLENLRFHLEEEGKGKNEKGEKVKASKEDIAKFRSQLSKYADVYVNDAFGTAHRAHSSMVGVQPTSGLKAAGFLMQKELTSFSKITESPDRPYCAILGGAKVADKIQLIENLLDHVNVMIIGGGMAYTFKKVVNNMPIGKSIYDENGAKLIPKLIKKAQEKNVKLLLPVDFRTTEKFDNDGKIEIVDDKKGIKDTWMGLDIGPKTAMLFASEIWKCKSIIFNGPMGVFEFPNFSHGTTAVLHACAAAHTINNANVIIGGGDTASAAKNEGISKFVTHVSTGGGASLELLEGKKLPGVVALSEKKSIQSKL